MSRIRSARAQAFRVLRGGDDAINEQPPESEGAPLWELLEQRPPGVTPDYVVLPRRLLTDMPPQWQQQLGYLLNELHRVTQDAPWPVAYRVTPLRPVPLSNLNEGDLRRLDLSVEYDDTGELAYRHAHTGETVTSPERRRVLVPGQDALAADPRHPAASPH